MALVRGLAIPLYRFSIALFHALTIIITNGEIILCFGIALLRSLANPLGGLCIVFCYSIALGIALCKLQLSLGVSSFGRYTETFDGLGIRLCVVQPFAFRHLIQYVLAVG